PTLGDARDLDAVAGGKNRYGHRLARLGRLSCRGGDREALQHPRRRLEACFLYMTRQGLRRPLGLLRTEAQLDLRPAHLHHGARSTAAAWWAAGWAPRPVRRSSPPCARYRPPPDRSGRGRTL